MNALDRFSSRVEDYVRFRPGYPSEIVTALSRDCGLNGDSMIADIGCGPGNLARIFLENGNPVFGIEPNGPMREAGIAVLERFGNFHPVEGRAEATGLPSAIVDFITAGQAFHWFEPESARAEFRRSLKPGGWVVLVWNERPEQVVPFLDEYESILQRYGIDYRKVRESRNNEQTIIDFFGNGDVQRALFTHAQSFDFEGLKGRLLSCSYAPPAGYPAHAPMLKELRDVFERHRSRDGRVEFPYETTMWYCRLG